MQLSLGCAQRLGPSGCEREHSCAQAIKYVLKWVPIKESGVQNLLAQLHTIYDRTMTSKHALTRHYGNQESSGSSTASQSTRSGPRG